MLGYLARARVFLREVRDLLAGRPVQRVLLETLKDLEGDTPRQPEEPQHRTKSLDEFLAQLVAAQDGVHPDEVTVEYIRDQRISRFYPKTPYHIGFEFFTRDQLAELNRTLEAKIKRL